MKNLYAAAFVLAINVVGAFANAGLYVSIDPFAFAV
jgi:hypothetical protein